VFVRVERLVVGLGLVGIGVVWTLGNLGKLDALETLHRWWPLLLVVWGGLDLAAWAARGSQARRS
jgi:cell wall-active antibiotic response 4TMS protein YvqF